MEACNCPEGIMISVNYLVEKKYEQTKQHTCLEEEKNLNQFFLNDHDDAETL